MRIALALLAPGDGAGVAAQVRYHLDRGIDVVVAGGMDSADGRLELLHPFVRDGRVHVLPAGGDGGQSEETRAARFAAEELAADWVVHAGAGEFWWPRLGSVRETLAAVPRRFGVVRGLVRCFVPRLDGGEPWFERMIVRHPSTTDPADPYRARVKVAHRGSGDVVVVPGGDDANGDGLALLHEWFPFEILQFGRQRAGAPAVALDDELARAVAAGRLAIDVRLRDLLREGETQTRQQAPESFEPERQPAAARALAADIGAFMEIEPIAALRSGTTDLDRRLTQLERSLRIGAKPVLGRLRDFARGLAR